MNLSKYIFIFTLLISAYSSAQETALQQLIRIQSELLTAITNDDLNSVQSLLDRYEVDLNYVMLDAMNNDTTPLIEAIRVGNPNIVRLLLSKLANPNYSSNSGDTPLRSAVERENIDIIVILLDARVNPDGPNRPTPFVPLIWAVRMNNTDIVKILLFAGADPNKKDSLDVTPLIEAIESDVNSEILTALLGEEADKSELSLVQRIILWWRML